MENAPSLWEAQVGYVTMPLEHAAQQCMSDDHLEKTQHTGPVFEHLHGIQP